jgi:hypothetical protein
MTKTCSLPLRYTAVLGRLVLECLGYKINTTKDMLWEAGKGTVVSSRHRGMAVVGVRH